ncbi:MAG TPA: flagellar biosynthesis protein FlhA [Polyangiales bacterium]|nr:flagellar biosynthesis protein FlhA [Polyangiales bacterium]
MSTAVSPTLAKSSSLVASILPLVLVGIVLMMVIPLPSLLLDLLLAVSMALSLALLLVSLQVSRVLDLSAFPSILLFITLLRLSLNVASTRLILLHGADGTEAAGEIIRAFGEFMIGGNYIVGATVFVLLIVINFVVITKGAGRVAEVSARFALDAMPGKQMAIDAELAAGAIDQDVAKLRRKEVEQESDFFGAMDGASKFVRGDAIAAVLMTSINIIVGFIVGMVQHEMSAGDAAATYTILAVGEGLVSQIPALLVSTAAAVMVTRASLATELSPVLIKQLSQRKNALQITAGILGVIGLLPGMPMLPFFALSGAILWGARANLLGDGATATAGAPGAAPKAGAGDKKHEPTERERIEEMLPVELVELEVGYDLVSLVDQQQGGELIERVSAIRRNLAAELGIIVPAVHIRDNLRLRPGAYRLMLSGNEIGKGELRVHKLMAMDPTGSAPPLNGENTTEPAFGLPARWISQTDRELAESYGYTVVDPATVAATHFTEMLRSAAPDLLGRTEAQELVDLFARREPKLVDELIPNLLSLGEVIKVLRLLLKEGVSVRDLRSVFESLCDHARETKDTVVLSELVRSRLARQITARFVSEEGKVAALVLDPRAEEAFRHGFPDASGTQRLLSSLDSAARGFAGLATPPVLICAADVRRNVSEFLARRVPGLSVLSYREIDGKTTVRTLGVVTV